MTAFSTSSCSVLIVEDQPIVAWDLSEQLTSLGYVVQAIADNGDDAVQFAVELRPSLIYMDISLRGPEDGVRVAQRIQQYVDVPVVFLTAHVDNATTERSLRANPYGYLIKPFDAHEIRTSASIAVNRHRAAQRARFLEVAFEDAQVGVVVLDAHTKQVVFKNRPFCMMFGLSPDLLPGETVAFRSPDPESHNRLIQAILQCQPYKGDFQIFGAGGRLFWNRVVLTLVQEGGATTHLMLQHSDVTEEYLRDRTLLDLDRALVQVEKTNQELSFHSDLHEALLAAPNMIAACTVALTTVSHLFDCFGGIALDLRRTDRVLCRVGNPPSAWQGVRPGCMARRVGDGMEVALGLARMDIGLIWWASRDPEPQGLSGALEELERAMDHWWVERQLRDTERRRALVYHRAFHGILSVGADGRIVESNEAADRLFGRSTPLVGLTAMEAFGATLSLDQLVTPPLQERSLLLPDGRALMVETEVVRTEEPTWTFFVRDITERMQAQHAMEAAKNAALEADRVKSEFLASMSHEIRTPLNAVLGMTEIALHSGSPVEVHACLERIAHNGDALLGLLNGVLDFSKLNVGQLELEERAFDLWDLVGSVLEAQTSRAQQKGLNLRLFLDPEVPVEGIGDAQRLRQVLLNLLSNAIKFTDQGRVDLRLRRGGPGRLEFTVQDTGIGMSPEDVARVFDKFYRSKQASSYAGTGLGLTISRSLVEKMGGTITVESRLGVGTTFRVDLPVPAGATVPLRPAFSGLVAIHVADREEREELTKHLLAAGYRTALWYPGLEPQVLLVDAEAEAEVRSLRERGVHLVGIAQLGSGASGAGFAQMLYRPYGPTRLRKVLEGLAPANPPIPTPEPHPVSTHRKVLVVDDSLSNGVIARSFLMSLHLQVELVRDGYEAVAMLERRDYAMVLMDLHMATVDGLEATARIRALEAKHGYLRTPIIALTGATGSEVEEACRQAGMDEVLTKPTTVAQFQAVAERWIDARPTVLVVDDFADMRTLLGRFLENTVRVLTAASGPQALQLLERHAVDLALIDIEMPSMNGLELAQQIRTRGWPLICVAMTGHNGAEMRQACATAGFNTSFTKPVNSAYLRENVRRLLDERS